MPPAAPAAAAAAEAAAAVVEDDDEEAAEAAAEEEEEEEEEGDVAKARKSRASVKCTNTRAGCAEGSTTSCSPTAISARTTLVLTNP